MFRRIDVKNGDPALSGSRFGKSLLAAEEVEITSRSRAERLFEKIAIRPGLKMIVANHYQPKAGRIVTEIEHAPVSLTFNLLHRSRCTIWPTSRTQREVERPAGKSVLAYLPKTRCIIETPPGQTIFGVSVHFSLGAFHELFQDTPPWLDRVVGGPATDGHFYWQSRFNAHTSFILRQIVSCPYQNEIRRLYLEAKALELVALKLVEMGQAGMEGSKALTFREMDRVREAYHILQNNLQNPPGLDELGRMVGMNRNKLNLGFKKIYGATAFNLLQAMRLQAAWSLLATTDLPLADIALAAGYNSQANFTTAFVREFGITPSTVRKESLGLCAAKSMAPPQNPAALINPFVIA